MARIALRYLAPALGLFALVGCGRTSLVVASDGSRSDGGLDAPFDVGRLDVGPFDGGPFDGGTDVGLDARPDAGSDADVGVPDGGRDAGRDTGTDASIRCMTDGDCDDGVFCNGAERCAVDACVPGAPVACPSDMCFDGFCDEAARACGRTPRDNDGDGFVGVDCGGDDCDDGTPTVFPGAMELCRGGVDDDCDALADCADTDCAVDPLCMVGSCPDRDLGSALGELSRGTTVTATADFTGSCASTGARDLAFRWTAPTTGTYVFDTRGSALDTVLYVRAGGCMGAELGCNDDGAGMQDSLVRLPLAAGDVVILFVDGFGMGAGTYILNVTQETSAEVCTNGRDDDRDGLVDCADPDCAGAPSCCVSMPEDCGNGTDDDCDSAIDCSDPDCVAAPACCSPVPEVCTNGRDDDCDRRVDCGDTECATSPTCCVPAPENCTNGEDDDCDGLIDCADAVCNTAPACCALRTEACGNGSDDDCDGLVDCMDPECTIDPLCLPTCPERSLGSRTGASLATGTTVGQGNDQMASCGGGGRGPDVTFGWTAPRTATYVFDTMGSTFDTVLHLKTGDCTGPELACDDDAGAGTSSLITRTITAGTRLVIVVDSFNTMGGMFVLSIRPVTSETGRCTDGVDNDADGFIDCVDSECASDISCCVPVAEVCGDMIDNDCDRIVDCADPNCRTSPACCTSTPEVCDNFGDDDCDGFVDCVDSDCAGTPPC